MTKSKETSAKSNKKTSKTTKSKKMDSVKGSEALDKQCEENERKSVSEEKGSVDKSKKTKSKTKKQKKSESKSKVLLEGGTSNDADDAAVEQKKKSVVPALLMGSYHLPGYTWRQDLWQYLTNNHPLFGICCRHPLHPVGRNMRIAGLIGSVMFGLAITNIIYLSFVFTDEDYDKTFITIEADLTTDQAFVNESVSNNLSASHGSVALWTIGGALHALYDNTIWSIAAWAWDGDYPERVERYHSNAKAFLIILSVVIAIALATFAAALRAALDDEDIDFSDIKSGGIADDTVEIFQIDGANDLEFLVAFIIELCMTFFVWYPLVGTILFTGVLGCFRFPVLGGRPYDLLMEEREKERLCEESAKTDSDIELGSSSEM